MMFKKTVLAALFAKLALGHQAEANNANPNLPNEMAKHYVPSHVNTNTLKYPIINDYCCDEDSSTTLLSIDGTLVPLMADAGWYTVTYGSQYTYADQIFVLNLRKTAIIKMTACFCPGNIFQVFDNGSPIMLTDDCTWPVEPPVDCSQRETDPQLCSESALFCDGAAILEPGYHNISIGVLASPWGAGAAYVRVDTAAQGPNSFMNLPLTPLCQMDPDPNNWTCNQNIVE